MRYKPAACCALIIAAVKLTSLYKTQYTFRRIGMFDYIPVYESPLGASRCVVEQQVVELHGDY